MNLKETILNKINAYEHEIIEWRRYLHEYPELSNEEIKTGEFVQEKLRSFGIKRVTGNYAGTNGVVADIGKNYGKNVAIRCDIDALPILEKNDAPYKSKCDGKMHACGHDAHTSIALGIAKILKEHEELINGSIRIIFQPCEEIPNYRGAKYLIDAGVLDNPKIDAIFGLHVYPELQTGKIGSKPGALFASTDLFKITIIGKGTHSSQPHKGADPIVTAAQFISSLNHIVSRKVDPLLASVISVGKIQGGTAANIIPEQIYMEGTARTLDLKLAKKFPTLIEETLKGICQVYGCEYKLDYLKGTPPVINEDILYKFSMDILKEALGKDTVVELEKPTMGGEDFAEYLLRRPGVMFRLGIRNENKGIIYPLHSPYFNIDESSLKLGVFTLLYPALMYLNSTTSHKIHLRD